jgi:hypothetical protein
MLAICHDGCASSFELPHISSIKLTVHREWTHGFPLPNGPADARCMLPGCDPRWSMLSSSSSTVLLYISALRSWILASYFQHHFHSTSQSLHHSTLPTFSLVNSSQSPLICCFKAITRQNLYQNVLPSHRTLFSMPMPILQACHRPMCRSWPAWTWSTGKDGARRLRLQ